MAGVEVDGFLVLLDFDVADFVERLEAFAPVDFFVDFAAVFDDELFDDLDDDDFDVVFDDPEDAFFDFGDFDFEPVDFLVVGIAFLLSFFG